jgi:hypothetical protein
MRRSMKGGGAEVRLGWAVFIGALLINCSIDNARSTWDHTSYRAIVMPRPSRKGHTAERLVLCGKRSGPFQA